MNAPLVSTIVTTEQHVLTLPDLSSVHVKKDTRGTEYVAQVIYLVTREHEGTARDTEGVGQDMSIPLKLFLVSGSPFSEASAQITTSI